ncbi:unnamed protein product [Ectocarpus sp. 13 AM-2016]
MPVGVPPHELTLETCSGAVLLSDDSTYVISTFRRAYVANGQKGILNAFSPNSRVFQIELPPDDALHQYCLSSFLEIASKQGGKSGILHAYAILTWYGLLHDHK